MKINSCIYEGTIRHRRFVESKREFKYRLFMMYVDLDEVDSVFDKYWLWSAGRPNVAWMRRADYLGGKPNKLSDSVRSLVHDQLGVTPEGPIRLLTNFRYFGFGINPISIYYCFNKAGQVEFVVAEVTNTPWGEIQTYVLDGRGSQGKNVEASTRKLLHVSPFLGMDYEYQFQVGHPDGNLSVHIANHRLAAEETVGGLGSGNKADFDATLLMKRRQLSSLNLARVLCCYPLLTAQVFGKIHWQAFWLWMRGVAYKKHPKHRQEHENKTSSDSKGVDSQAVAVTSTRPSDSKPHPTETANSMERHETTL